MANVLVDETSLQNIADAIREKGGTSNYKPSQMANAIKTVYDNGIKKEVALFSPYTSNEGQTYTTLWDILQDKGNRTDYNHLFVRFTDESFKPIYDMEPTKAASMFEYSKITDLVKLLDAARVHLFFGGLTTLPYRMFAFSTITHCPYVMMPPTLDLNCMFYSCSKLETIDGVMTDSSNKFTSTFNGCTSLKNISFEGSEIGNNISFSVSPLSRESIESVINALSDNVRGKALTLKATAKMAVFTDSEWATLIATKPNWTISLV